MVRSSRRRAAWWLAVPFVLFSILPAAEVTRRGEPHRRSMTGTVIVVQEDDFEAGTSRRVHLFRETSTGTQYRLRLEAEQGVLLRSGTLVRLRGVVEADEIRVAPGDTEIAMLSAGEVVAAQTRETIVLIVDFDDAPVSCSDDAVAAVMFEGQQSVDGLYRESSFGAVSFPPDTDLNGLPDVLRVSISSTTVGGSCDAFGWAGQADQAATGAGVNLALYRHRLYVLPSGAPCSWAGLATVGCSGSCRAWVKTCHLPDVYAHELGHNLGLRHASTDEDNDGSIDCEYCDRSDFMGIGGVGWRQINGPHKIQMGWLPQDRVVVAGQQGDQTLAISPLETDPALAAYPQVVRVELPGVDDPYYLSYRRRVGYDAGLGSGYSSRTSIHRQDNGGFGNTLFLDALADGQDFEDTAAGITFTQLSHDDLSATVLISTGCEAEPPDVVLNPASRSGHPGDARTYTVSVTNADSSACASTTFILTADAPQGWPAGVSTSSLTLGPGGQGTATLTVTPPAGTAPGSYPAGVIAGDGAAAVHDAQGSASYVVQSTAPDPPDDLQVSLRQAGLVRLDWSAVLGAVFYRVQMDGVTVGETSATGYMDMRDGPGSYLYRVIAVNAAGEPSVPGNEVEVTLSPAHRSGRSAVRPGRVTRSARTNATRTR